MKRMMVILTVAVFALVSQAAELRILIVNAAGVDAKTAEAVRAHADKELFVPVAVQTVEAVKGDDLKVIGKLLAQSKKDTDVCLIALADVKSAGQKHAVVLTNEQVAVVNVAALQSDDAVKFTRRLQKWALRGAAMLMGVGPDMDPHSVMHDYTTLEELDKLGLNFSPPWMDMVRQAEAKRGLKVRPEFPPDLSAK